MNLDKQVMIKTSIVAFSDKGASIASTLVDSLSNNYQVKAYYKKAYPKLLLNTYNLDEFTKMAFNDSRLIIYIGAIGIATRAIAPYIKAKDVDPAIICIDDNALYVVPILSGHLGSANEYASYLSNILKAQAIITTSTDLNNTFAVDLFALKNDLYINDKKMIKHISSRLLENKKIGFYTDYPLNLNLPNFIDDNKDIGLCLSDNPNLKPFKQTINLTYRKYVVGIGVRKDKDPLELEEFFLDTLKNHQIDYHLVSDLVSIDLKKNEQALIDLSSKYRLSFQVYSSLELQQAKGSYTSSAFVKSITGVDNVCERSVALKCGYENIILKKTVRNGMTIAIGIKEIKVEF